jgi:hypothetical protein
MTEELVKLTIDEAVTAFKKSKDTIYYWIKTGKYSSEQGENGKILVLTKQQYDYLLSKIEVQQNTVNNANENCNDIQSKSNSEDLKYIIENLRYFADIALQEKENRVLLLEDYEKQKEISYLEAQAKIKELENRNSILEFQLKEAEEKLNTIELKLKDNDSLKDLEINALKKQVEEIKLNQISPEEYKKVKNDNLVLSYQIENLLKEINTIESKKKGMKIFGLFTKKQC